MDYENGIEMNCAQARRYILLTNELSPTEQEILDRHCATCDSCRAYHTELRGQQEAWKGWARMKPEPESPRVLTNKIMDAIRTEKAQNQWSDIIRHHLGFGFQWVRYSMGVISLILVVLFAYEYTQPGKSPTQNPFELSTANLVMLDSEKLLKVIQSERGQPKNRAWLICLDVCSTPGRKVDCESCQGRYKN